MGGSAAKSIGRVSENYDELCRPDAFDAVRWRPARAGSAARLISAPLVEGVAAARRDPSLDLHNHATIAEGGLTGERPAGPIFLRQNEMPGDFTVKPWTDSGWGLSNIGRELAKRPKAHVEAAASRLRRGRTALLRRRNEPRLSPEKFC